MPRTYGRVRQALRDAGWRVVRQKGSHRFRVSPDGTRAVSVAGKDSDTMVAGTLASTRRRTGLEDLR
ncbi:MAG: addiction module toxin, HicA family [Actinobacteria bacterium]|nr:addiction module toxin, HicA family [Actinomycetota bacterium]MBM3697266.1 addiction module toxin, HicA family [Actinomycetota bacterium]